MIFIIGLILLLIALYIIGFFVKKKYYTQIDKLEARKIETMNRPVMDEVSKIKQLQMEGEAEEYFERWRSTWDEVVAVELPNVEELLYDAEEYVDKYRFKKAKMLFETIETTLNEADCKIDEMLLELGKIVESEQKNREEIAEVRELHKNLKKEILARRHAFGKASELLEKSIDKVKEDIEEFEAETLAGNYITAREIVVKMKEELGILQEKMENIPILLNECLHVIPSQFKELRNGVQDMRKEDYQLDHLDIESVIENLEERLQTYVELIEKTEIEEVHEGIEEIKEQLDTYYDLLENEVTAKQFVLTNRHELKESLEKVESFNTELVKEVEEVKLSYHLSEEDETIINEMREKIETIRKTAVFLIDQDKIKESAFSVVKEKMETILADLSEIEKNQQDMKEMLHTLRKDEHEAREKIVILKRKIQNASRLVKRSNVPGIPQEIASYFDEARSAIKDCFTYLDETPLNMQMIRQSLSSAEEKVNNLYDQVVEMIENVYFIEKIIQYGNRYRSRNDNVQLRLTIAEDAFRSFDYDKALEEAAAAVEEAEPGAIKRIEELINEELKDKDIEDLG
ncbi:septation ring formation regulator EzrA [Pallidibacillus pasinlerensis]|uniref:Septation ring formation regulator EzrA n=1 Tax=Pallidibacillus pasinlerensis TaxID=2703818 RepID=A0ABX0A6H3_9BACI|nr:septation ring formation regulator EzrA [Pallidibacillus pasinlerensis]NCU17005.1 septation ring formation regulator EzrA [Pallidibacillus pasinlerensis]